MDIHVDLGKPIEPEFFKRSVDEIAYSLVGCWLFTNSVDGLVGGRIVETEAYCQNDPAAHCYDRKSPGSPNERSSMCVAMFGPPGSIYIYPNSKDACHLNLVGRDPAQKGKFGSAVLIRAIEPTHSIDCMRTRRSSYISDPKNIELCSGPIKLCQALAIDYELFDGKLIGETSLGLYDRNPTETIVVHCDQRIRVPNGWPRRYLLPSSAYLSSKTVASFECTPERLASVAALRTASDMHAFFEATPRS